MLSRFAPVKFFWPPFLISSPAPRLRQEMPYRGFATSSSSRRSSSRRPLPSFPAVAETAGMEQDRSQVRAPLWFFFRQVRRTTSYLIIS